MKQPAKVSPSIKKELEEFEDQISREVKDIYRSLELGSNHTDGRIQRLEEKETERELSKMSVVDYMLIACYSVLIIGAIIATVRNLKRYTE